MSPFYEHRQLSQAHLDFAQHCRVQHRNEIQAFASEALNLLGFLAGIVGAILRGVR